MIKLIKRAAGLDDSVLYTRGFVIIDVTPWLGTKEELNTKAESLSSNVHYFPIAILPLLVK